jgi:hypothetical protein
MTLPVVLNAHRQIKPMPIFRSIRHPFSGTTINNPNNVTNNVTPLMTNVVLTSSL